MVERGEEGNERRGWVHLGGSECGREEREEERDTVEDEREEEEERPCFQ